ncbi:hypothetical protein [Haloglycomyces albus]|uniref:hypothetical protein n=1 Tax=Haloglycomyces albus TaxID=526067 RepID=UPI0004A47F50|nr:hypothetical protein [Haloglycomyces albus]
MPDPLHSVSMEIEALHRDLAFWLGTEAAPEVLDRFLAAQHEDFSLVSVDGGVVSGPELAAQLPAARNAQPGLNITISDVVVIVQNQHVNVVRFRETHSVGRDQTSRLVTATLVDSPEAERGYRWLAVHETAEASLVA